MAKYKTEQGFKVQTLASDTTATGIPGATWSSGGSLNTARQQLGASGTQTAGLGFGGSTGSNSALNEEYNGTAWTEKADLNVAKTNGAGTPAGTTTAALFYGGYGTDNVATNESWNGSAWTEVNDLNQARRGISGAGTQTAAVAFGGQTPGDSANTETWNGSSWTEVNNLNTARGSAGGAGISTGALCVGGSPNPGYTESWNGTSWTEVSDLNSGRNELECAGLQPSMIAFGGAPGSGTAATEFWNGSSWTEVADLATARFSVAGIGSSTAGLAGGGSTGSVTAVTEEFTAPSAFSKLNLGQVFFNSTTNTFRVTGPSIPGGTWASGGNMNETRNNVMGQAAGSKTAALIWGGKQAPPASITKTESYNGSSWSEVNDLNTARQYSGGAGTQTAALAFGNTSSSGITESWNGSSWTEVNDMNTGRNYVMWSGIQTSALAGAGYTTTMVNNAETWDGTSWTEVNEVNEARDGCACAGQSNTAGLIAGGYHTTSPPTNTQNTEIWNGSSWTEVNNLNGKTRAGTGGGTTTAAFCAGGQNDPPSGPPWQVTVANVEYWNGTSWTEINDLSTAVNEQGGRGGTSGAFTAGGSPSPTGLNTMEIWTAAETNSTITAT
jgi:hypothetical protein